MNATNQWMGAKIMTTKPSDAGATQPWFIHVMWHLNECPPIHNKNKNLGTKPKIIYTKGKGISKQNPSTLQCVALSEKIEGLWEVKKLTTEMFSYIFHYFLQMIFLMKISSLLLTSLFFLNNTLILTEKETPRISKIFHNVLSSQLREKDQK